ncbi:MAG TPA: DUF4112 domain-containing protein [Methyloceanibacter sp.]|jgi:hypothetical protein|nr:DUF4112 domain-containing protein [Methyloceanibacter sp.]
MSSRIEILDRNAPDPWSVKRGPADYFREFTAGMSHEERLAQVRWFANLMDDAFRVPGTPLRFGWDSVLGLFPGLGDVLTSALSLLIVHHAWQTGASKLTLARMLGNVGLDFAIGAIPFLGDLFDFAFKANRRNARLLEQHLNRQRYGARQRFGNSSR